MGEKTTFMRAFDESKENMQSRQCHSTFTAEFTRNFSHKICFTIPTCAPTERRQQSGTFQMFQCVCCSNPESGILVDGHRECGVSSAAPFSRYVSASIAEHSSDPFDLSSEPLPKRRSEVCELGWLQKTLPSTCKGILHCITWCPCTLSIHEKTLGAPRAR